MRKIDVSTRSKRLHELHEKRDLVNALMGGTAKMIEEGREFLPQHKNESDDNYKVRLQATTLVPTFKDTVVSMSGRPFSKSIKINDDVPPTIADICQNIDGQGRNITSFFYDGFKMAMVDGISYVHVDMPALQVDGREPSRADQKAAGARPNAILIDADDIISVESGLVNGITQITKARIKQTVYEPDPSNPWNEIEIKQIRVMYIGRWEIYREVEKGPNAGEWYIHDEGINSLSYIPLEPIYINRVGFYEGEPPLQGLADLVLSHWRSTSAQCNALSYARFAMLYITGLSPDDQGKITVGPSQKITVSNENAKIGYIEPTGAAIEAGRKDIEYIEKRMENVTMNIAVQNKTGGVTATAAVIDSIEANAALLSAISSLEDSIANILQMMADYLKLGDGGTVEVWKGFAERAPDGTPQDVLAWNASGILSKETTLAEGKRRGFLDKSLDIESELAKTQNEPIL